MRGLLKIDAGRNTIEITKKDIGEAGRNILESETGAPGNWVFSGRHNHILSGNHILPRGKME